MDGPNGDSNKIGVKTSNFICPNCGGTLKFNIKSQVFECSACKTRTDLEAVVDSVKEYDFSEYKKREAGSVPFEGMAVAHCSTCGAEITFSGTQFSGVCPMCGSTQIAEEKQRSGIPPEGVVTFKIDKDDAGQKFRSWVRSRWFAPNNFKKSYAEGGLTAMYLPFWTYDTKVVARYYGQGGVNRTVRGDDGKPRVVTDWYSVSGVVYNDFDDIQVSATDKSEHLQGILPFNTVNNTKPFSMGYLSGYYAEVYKIKADAAFEQAKLIIRGHMDGLAHNEILMRYDQARVSSLDIKHSDIMYKHLLLPVYVSSFRFNGKTFSYAINGETGRISGKRPYSAPKIIAAAIALIIVVLMLSTFLEEDSYGYIDNYDIVSIKYDNNIEWSEV
ncbi:MAG: hypothetical protein LBV08_07210 [Clostridiales bacterium]|nr:hypothetical protein [Clostridiales bacterium]